MSIDDQKPGETAKELGLRLQVAQKILELLTAAFSLVAALAWNDAVQALFLRIFGQTNGIVAKFIYAVLITAIVVWIAFRLSSITKKLDKKINP